MKYGLPGAAGKRPRYHAGIAWEEKTLTNEFIDITRMALDDRYGHNGAPLSKRRNGIGFTQGNTPGLFGIGGVVPYASKKQAYFFGIATGVGAYIISDFYLNQGHGLEGWKRRLARSPMAGALVILLPVLLGPSD